MTNDERKVEGRAVANELSLAVARLQKLELSMQAKLNRRAGTRMAAELEKVRETLHLLMDAIEELDELYGRDGKPT